MKKLRFMNDLIIKSLPGKETRRLVEHFIVKYDNRYIVVPEGFVTDYASIPKMVPRWIVDQDDGIIREAAVLHDYLYSKKGGQTHKRKFCDQLLYEGMLELGSPKWKAMLVYSAVRMFGWLFYKKDTL